MKVGIMGGTFDPIHQGHLLAAESAREEAGLDQIWFIPASVPPHKTNPPKGSVRQRWEMVEKAIKDHPHFRAEDMEIRRGGTSYTIETAKELKRRYPHINFHYIIGADMVQYLPNWVQIDQLVNYISFIGMQRPGFSIQLDSLPNHIGSKVILLSMPLVEISSTEIRERRKHQRSIRYLVPESIYTYIEENRLYET